MRRKDREQSFDFAMQVIDECEYGVLGMVMADNSPYCVALSMARHGDELYFHCAKLGQKLDALRANPKVCVSFNCGTYIPENAFTTAYKSAVVFGTAQEVENNDEKLAILRILCEKLTPKNMANFDEEINSSMAATSVWKIKMESTTAKAKII